MALLRRLFRGGTISAAEPRVRAARTGAVPPVASTAALPSTGPRERVDLRTDLPAGYRHLIQGPSNRPILVVGESFYRAAIEAAVGRRPEGHRTIVDAALVWEPESTFDPNTIAVQIAGQTCGHLSKLDARRYRPVLDWAETEGVVPVVRADVSGGWQMDDGSWADFGIRLYVATPGELLGPLAEPPPVVISEHRWAGQTIAFTGDSRCAIDGILLDRASSKRFARGAGMVVHPRVTKSVQLLVDCDDRGVSGNQRKAIQYGVPVIREYEFWTTLGLAVETVD